MKSKPSEEEFLSRVKTTLDASSERLDELTQARLSAARRRAVEAATHQERLQIGEILSLRWLSQHRGLVATAATITLATAFMLSLNFSEPQTAVVTAQLEDLELLSSSDDLELYENLDFYLWIDDDQLKS